MIRRESIKREGDQFIFKIYNFTEKMFDNIIIKPECQFKNDSHLLFI